MFGQNNGEWQFVSHKRQKAGKGKGKGKGAGGGTGRGKGGGKGGGATAGGGHHRGHGAADDVFFVCKVCDGCRNAKFTVLDRCRVCNGPWKNKEEILAILTRRGQAGRAGGGTGKGADGKGGGAKGKGGGGRSEDAADTMENARPSVADMGIFTAAILAQLDRAFGDKIDVKKFLQESNLDLGAMGTIASQAVVDSKKPTIPERPKSKRERLEEARQQLYRADQSFGKLVKEGLKLDKAKKETQMQLDKVTKDSEEVKRKEQEALEGKNKALEKLLAVKAEPDDPLPPDVDDDMLEGVIPGVGTPALGKNLLGRGETISGDESGGGKGGGEGVVVVGGGH